MITIDSSGFADVVMTQNGDLVDFRGGARSRLAIGSENDVLTVSSSLPEWSAPTHPTPTAIQYSVATMSGVDFDFDSSDMIQTISISGTTTFTGSNYAAGKGITCFILTDGSDRDLAFPAGWVFQGTKPTSQAASKTGTLTVLSTTTAEAGVRCAYAVEE